MNSTIQLVLVCVTVIAIVALLFVDVEVVVPPKEGDITVTVKGLLR